MMLGITSTSYKAPEVETKLPDFDDRTFPQVPKPDPWRQFDQPAPDHHWHLREYYYDQVIADILYRHEQPAMWAAGDITMIWLESGMKVLRSSDNLIFEVKSFTGTSRRVSIEKCTGHCYTPEGIKEWLESHPKKD